MSFVSRTGLAPEKTPQGLSQPGTTHAQLLADVRALVVVLRPPIVVPVALFAGLAKDLPRDPETHYLFAQWACVNDKNELCVAESTKAISLSGTNPEAIMQLNTLRGIANDTLSGGTEGDVFIFADGFGTDIITDFEAVNPNEKIDLSDLSTISSFSSLMTSNVTQIGADVLLDDHAGNTILLQNMLLTSLNSENFVF